ncbi:MAG TPA: S8 family serine peptidase [Bacteroidia bacterium]|nr:S8 family serine peptidase [Bacteroidia bacterium]
MFKNVLFAFLILGSGLAFCQEIFPAYRDGQVYVKLKNNSWKSLLKENPDNVPVGKAVLLSDLAAAYGITHISRPFHQASDDNFLPWVLKISFSKKEKVNAFIRDLEKRSLVEFAEKVPLLRTDAVPNDPTIPVHLNQINAPNAWNVFNGNSNITVAIVDNAVMWTHSDLVSNTYTNTAEIAGNSIDDDGNGFVDDVNGYDVADLDNNAVPTNTAMDHGTHCAGIAGAATNNSLGIAAIGWNIKIIPVKCAYNTSGTSAIDAGYEGIIYAAKAKARVISCSWGGSGGAAVEQSVIDYAWNKGCIVVASAGNAGSNTPNYPGAYARVYCVASVNPSDQKSGFSNYGIWVDISAPGENIYSTVPSVSTGTYDFKSGTSMATPLVSGLAALMLSKCSWMSSTDVLNCISSTAVNIYTLGANSSYSVGNQLGAGRIEAFQAMTCASAFLTIPPVANFYAFPLVSCPNTPVQFYDSSLYVPLTYTWTFQGGSPAVSNSPSPSVQWLSPGTYSVTLSVTNANGSNAKTKLSYITIAGPQNLPFAEGFEGLAFLPPNWTPKNVNYDNVYWSRYNGVGGFGTSTACAIFDNYNFVSFGDRDEMRSPKYSFSNVVSARLRYDVAYARLNPTYSDTLEVKLSVNCGSTWSVVSIKGGTTLATRSDLASQFVPTSAQWRRDTFDISAATAGQSNVMFSFINHGQYGQGIYLDNINLYFPTPTLNVNPINPVCVGSTINPVNTSVGAGSYTWNFPGGSPASSSQSNASVSYTAPGVYTIQLIGANGSATAALTRTVTVNAYPVIGVNNPTVCAGSAAVFSLTGAASYTLQPGSLSGSVITVTPPSTSIYTITGSNSGCNSLANATAYVNPNPTLSASSSTVCNGSPAVLTYSGGTSYTTYPGGLSGPSVTLNPTATTIYTVTGSNGFCMSSVTTSAVVNPIPVISVNSASICYGESVALLANGATTYTWNTGSNASSITVTPLSSVVYTVSGSSLSCTASQTAAVLVNPAFTVSASSSSNNVCSQAYCLLSAGGAATYTWNTGAVSPSLAVGPLSSSSYTVTGSLNSCTNQAVVSITVIPTPSISISVSPSYSICSGSAVSMTANGAYTSFSWGMPVVIGSVNVAYPNVNTVYTLNASNISNGCYTSSLIPVTVSSMSNALSTGSILCGGTCTGTLNATYSGGIAPYSFSISSTSCSSLPCTSLCAGTFTFHLNDAIGCSINQSFTISAPPAMAISSVNISNASCASCNDGSLSVMVTGGIAPYSYTWIPAGGTGSAALNLPPACYTVNIVDANLCVVSSTACIGIGTSLGAQVADMHSALFFPNPVRDKLFVQWETQEFDLRLFNTLGQILAEKLNQQSSTELDLSALANGIYYAELRQGTQVLRTKLVLEK